MTVYTEISQIPEGQDLAIRFGETAQVERWTYTDGRFVGPDKQVMDPWFFTGLIDQGRVLHGDFAPAQPREWFQYNHDNRTWYLVLREESEHVLAVGHWRDWNGTVRWDGFSTIHPTEILRQFRRQPMPEWASDLLVTMTIYAREKERESHNNQMNARTMRQVNDRLRLARDYLTAAQETINSAERNRA